MISYVWPTQLLNNKVSRLFTLPTFVPISERNTTLDLGWNIRG